MLKKIGTVLLTSSLFATAGQVEAESAWTEPATISTIELVDTTSSWGWIKLNGVSAYNSCGGSETYGYMFVGTSDASESETLSMLMAAYLSGKSVILKTEPKDTSCRITRVRIQ